MPSFVYNQGAQALGDGSTLWLSASVKVLLLKGTGYTPNRDHNFVSSLSPGSNEVTVLGYARQPLTSKTIVRNDTDDRIEYRAIDTPFGSLPAGETVEAAVIFDDAGVGDGAHRLIAYADLPSLPTTGGTFTVAWDAATGCFYLSTV